MKMMSRIIRNDKPIGVAVHEGTVLLILLGDADAAAAFRGRMTAVKLICTIKDGVLHLKDAAGKAPTMIADLDAEADLKAAQAIHIILSNGGDAVPVARDVLIRWPAQFTDGPSLTSARKASKSA